MKYPALLPFADILPQLDAFDAIIDVRSESEYAEDHIPGAINCPVLNDAQRAEVGTLYKQVGPFDAKKRGAALVSHNIAMHLDALFQDKPRDWKPLVYCWRGGNRSGSLTHVLAKIGWPAVQLDGGYKEYRRHINTAMVELPGAFNFQVVCGPTGSGKSRLLQTLAVQGAQVLDLEMLAAHRGSVLGHLPDEPQPSQKMFESRIWQALRRFNPDLPVYVESESKKIGDLRVPDALMDRMRASPCIALNVSRNMRVALLIQEYAHFVQAPAQLNVQLSYLTALHGREKIARWQSMAEHGDIAPLVQLLLEEHYDPAYERSIGRNFSQFAHARQLQLEDISTIAFLQAAETLQK